MSFKFGFKNFKCFGTELQFIEILPINVIVGKNNSGKSSIIEMILNITTPNAGVGFSASKSHIDSNGEAHIPELIIESKLTAALLSPQFPSNTSGGSISGNHAEYAKKFYGKNVQYKLRGSKSDILEIENVPGVNHLTNLPDWNERSKRIGNSLKSPFVGKTFYWLTPERQISSESKNDSPSIGENGAGLTNAIQTFLNHAEFSSSLVEKDILAGLNYVFYPDHLYKRILTKHTSDLYEIFLEEDNQVVPVSNCGTGIKTVLLVLAYVHLLPAINKNSLSDYIFVFEELENNLHPSLLRKLLDYLYKQSLKHDFLLFFTTHSNVVIDFFSTIQRSQILHVKRVNRSSLVQKVHTFFDSKNVLMDLDVRPSDILQANGIIWVEGPSDRVYLNKLIEAWSDGSLHEETHYQFMYYGGRLLSHFSMDVNPEDNFIKMLKLNMNAAIVIDSDKKQKFAPINQTKKRLVEEVEKWGGFAWVTKGKEIENYIPTQVLQPLLEQPVITELFKSIFESIDEASAGEGTKWASKKVDLAEIIIKDLNIELWKQQFDLDSQMKSLIKIIEKWNHI